MKDIVSMLDCRCRVSSCTLDTGESQPDIKICRDFIFFKICTFLLISYSLLSCQYLHALQTEWETDAAPAAHHAEECGHADRQAALLCLRPGLHLPPAVRTLQVTGSDTDSTSHRQISHIDIHLFYRHAPASPVVVMMIRYQI